MVKCWRQIVPDRGSTLITNSAQTRQSTLTSHLFKVLQSTTNNCNYNCTHQKTGIKTHTKRTPCILLLKSIQPFCLIHLTLSKLKTTENTKFGGEAKQRQLAIGEDQEWASSVGKALDQRTRRYTDTGSIPQGSKGFFSQSQPSVQTLLQCLCSPRVQMHGHW